MFSLFNIRNKKGQTALVLLIVAAIALIFLAITMNWGKVVQIKTQATVGADSAIAATTSNLASYGESQIHTYLKDRFKYCKSTSVWVAIATLIIAIVVNIIFPGIGTAIAVYLAVIVLTLQVVVIQPGLTRTWNKLQKNLATEDQFIEQGASTAAGSVIADAVNVPDFFDMDMNARTYFSGNDEISRYGFFYTERMKMLQPDNILGIDDFLNGLKIFVNGIDCSTDENKNNPCCSANPPSSAHCETLPTVNEWALYDECTDPNDPRCNECCVPLWEIPPMQLNNGHFSGGKRLRPKSCSKDVIPSGCMRTFPPRGSGFGRTTNGYPFIYSPGAQAADPQGNLVSFRALVGEDDDQPLYNKNPDNPNGRQQGMEIPGTGFSQQQTFRGHFSGEDATGYHATDTRRGIFGMFWQMDDLQNKPISTISLAGTNVNVDAVAPMAENLYRAADDRCALSDFRSNKNSFQWKPGLDRYCSSRWPYDERCAKHNSSGTVQNCLVPGASAGSCSMAGCQSNNASLWPDDPADQMVLALEEFSGWAKSISEKEKADLNKTFPQWYAVAADWIAPKCDNSTSPFAGDKNVCNPDGDGALWALMSYMGGSDGQGGWYKILNDYMNINYAASGNFCVPPEGDVRLAGSYDPKKMSLSEKNFIDQNNWKKEWGTAPDAWGHLGDVQACLQYNMSDDERFLACARDAAPDSSGACPATMPGSCSPEQLPRAIATVSHPGTYNTSNCLSFVHWAEANAQAFTTATTGGKSIKEQLVERQKQVRVILEGAAGGRQAFRLGYDNIKRFLTGTCIDPVHPSNNCYLSPAEQLMLARKQYDSSKKHSQVMIYGWKDSKAKTPTTADQTNNTKPPLLWHLARVEVLSAPHCPEGICIARKIPWVRTYSKGFLGTTRCYELTDRNGKAAVRVTRWDQETGSTIFFNNMLQLWRVRTSHPNKTNSMKPEDLDAYCSLPGIGLTEVTKNQLYYGTSPDAITDSSLASLRKKLSGAFMINFPKQDEVTREEKDKLNFKNCLATANGLLGTGISSTSCMAYEGRTSAKGDHMEMFYTNCPKGTSKDNDTQKAMDALWN